ncbi:hypothetical protein Tco_0680947 [Tanacetum coccineum]|uniref:Uncharacterized protein n=1 Tax=Tanacetum coccineum TaxID=301880 RepID=A0ABQ4XN57_9ASTR
MFQNGKREVKNVVEIIKETVRLKLASFVVKNVGISESGAGGRVNLNRRGITIIVPLLSGFGSVCEEDYLHIFFRCDLVSLFLRRRCNGGSLDPHDWSRSQRDGSLGFFSIQFSLRSKLY